MSELEVDKVKEGAQILSYNFKTIKMKQKEVTEISRYMLEYRKVWFDDSKRTKEEKKKQEQLVDDFKVPGLTFVEQSKKLGSTEITEYQLEYAEGRITYDQLSEAFIVYFVKQF